MRFEHLGGGSHQGIDGKTYKKGDVVTSRTIDLEKVFPGKFRRCDLIPAPEDTAEEAPVSPKVGLAALQASFETKKIKVKPAGAPTPADARGTNVTSTFNVDSDFKVFQRGDLFHVYEGDKTTPINKNGLKRGDVEGAVTAYLEE